VLAFLNAAKFETQTLHEHPERLKPVLDELRVAAGPSAKTIRDALSAGMTLEEIGAKIQSAQ
jgi:hypothetical protein